MRKGIYWSSRNLRLSQEQRKIAPAIFKVLSFIKENHDKDSLASLQEKALEKLTAKGFKVDYVQITDAETLLPASDRTPNKIALAAAYLDNIRLIDNLPLN